jgi:hypothetical protein
VLGDREELLSIFSATLTGRRASGDKATASASIFT